MARPFSVVLIAGLSLACEPPATPPIAPSRAPSIPIVQAPEVSQQMFGAGRVTVGDTWTARTVASSESQGDAGAVQQTTYEVRLDVTVAGVVGDGRTGPAPARLTLRFVKSVRTYMGTVAPTEVHGRTYVLDAGTSGVRDEAGNAVSAKESELVQDAYPDVGTGSRLEQALPEGPLVVGKEAPGLAEATLRSLHPRAWSFDGGRASLARVRSDEATFDVAIEATSATGLRLSVKGEVAFRLSDRRQRGLLLRGTYVTAEPNGSTSGTFEMRRKID